MQLCVMNDYISCLIANKDEVQVRKGLILSSSMTILGLPSDPPPSAALPGKDLRLMLTTLSLLITVD